MAISAKFEANFDQFVSSTKNAEASLKSLETAGGKVGTTLDSMKSGALQLASAFGIAFSVGAVVSFGKELLRMGDEIVRVADRTGLTTKEVQQLSFAAGQSGNSIEELTGAIGQMQNRLSSGDKSAIGSLHDLGLSLEALSAAGPADQLEQIATAIAKIPDPAERTRIAMDLFGKSGTAILPTLTSQFAALRAEAPVMSDATVKALDRAGDQLGKFGQQLKVWAAESYNYAGQAFDAIVKANYNIIASFLDLVASVAKTIQAIPGMSTAFKALGIDTAALTANAQWFRDAAVGMGVQVEAAAPKVAKLGAAAKDAAVDIDGVTAAEKRANDILKETAELYKAVTAIERDAHALSMGWVKELNEAKATANKKEMDDTVKSIDDTAKLEREAVTLRMGLYATDTEMKIQSAHQWFDDEVAKLDQSSMNYAAHYNALLDIESLKIAAIENGAVRERAAISSVTGTLNQQIDAAFALAQALAAATGMNIATVGSRPGEGPGINGAAPSGGFNLGPAFSLGPAPSFAPPVISSHAAGGPVHAGLAMLHDDEYVVPKGGALVSRGGGGPNITIYVNGTAEDVARKIADILQRSIMQGKKLAA